MENKENLKLELATQNNILIKANEKKQKQRFLIILTILLITFLSVLTSVFFSYKSYQAIKNTSKSEKIEQSTYYKTLSVKYDGNTFLNISAIGNGYISSNAKNIEITNEGDEKITFNMKLESIDTSLKSSNGLTYIIYKNNQTLKDKELPLKDNYILEDTIEPSETIKYTILVRLNTALFESADTSNYYNSKILIEQNDEESKLLE